MKSSVDKRSAAAERQVALAAVGRALMGGTKAMREAGKTYLPQFEAESETAYQARLKSSWLFNGYRKTVMDNTGRVFDKPVEIKQGPNELSDWAENIDLAGRDLSMFARDVFESAMAGSGIAYVMVDAPRREGPVTRAQAEAENLRPYMSLLTCEEILGWKTAQVGNATVLSQLRIMESVSEEKEGDEFAEESIPQIRVLDRLDNGVRTRLYRKDKNEWKQVSEDEGGDFINTDIQEITVAPLYLNRCGFFKGEPLLDDLADVNVAHWQSQSDQRNILHYARTPILFGAGFSDDADVVIASSSMVKSDDPTAKLEWVEHSGQAIGAGRQDLKDLEFQMEALGLQLLVQKTGQQSATGEVLDAKKETSTLSMSADALKDCLEQAFSFMAMYGGLDGDIEVDVNKEFGVSMMTPQEFAGILAAVANGTLSRETALLEMSRRGMIAPDIDPEEEAERIAAQPPELTGNPLDLGVDD